MRLIDSDKLRKQISDAVKKQKGKSTDLVLIKELFIVIDMQPTISEQEIRDKAISNFAEWCYLKGVDFSYMSASNKSGRQFIDDVIARYCKEQIKEE